MDAEADLTLKEVKSHVNPILLEKGLLNLLAMKWCTNLVANQYKVDESIAASLMKLYKDDAACSFMRHVMDWNKDRLVFRILPVLGVRHNSPLVQWRNARLLYIQDTGDESIGSTQWPYYIEEGEWLETDFVDRFQAYDAAPEGETWRAGRMHPVVPLEFALVVLLIKVRYLTVYWERAMAVSTLLRAWAVTTAGVSNDDMVLGPDPREVVLSFLLEHGSPAGFG